MIEISDEGKKVMIGYCDNQKMINPKYINLTFIQHSQLMEKELLDNKISFNYLIDEDGFEIITENRKTNGSYHTPSGHSVQTPFSNPEIESVNIGIVAKKMTDVYRQMIHLHDLLKILKKKWKIKKLKMNQNIHFTNLDHKVDKTVRKYNLFFEIPNSTLVDITIRYLLGEKTIEQ